MRHVTSSGASTSGAMCAGYLPRPTPSCKHSVFGAMRASTATLGSGSKRGHLARRRPHSTWQRFGVPSTACAHDRSGPNRAHGGYFRLRLYWIRDPLSRGGVSVCLRAPFVNVNCHQLMRSTLDIQKKLLPKPQGIHCSAFYPALRSGGTGAYETAGLWEVGAWSTRTRLVITTFFSNLKPRQEAQDESHAQ